MATRAPNSNLTFENHNEGFYEDEYAVIEVRLSGDEEAINDFLENRPLSFQWSDAPRAAKSVLLPRHNIANSDLQLEIQQPLINDNRNVRLHIEVEIKDQKQPFTELEFVLDPTLSGTDVEDVFTITLHNGDFTGTETCKLVDVNDNSDVTFGFFANDTVGGYQFLNSVQRVNSITMTAPVRGGTVHWKTTVSLAKHNPNRNVAPKATYELTGKIQQINWVDDPLDD